MNIPSVRPWVFRAVALLAFLIAQLLVLAFPIELYEPDDWGFRHASSNFAHGQVTITSEQYTRQSQETWDAGGLLLSYANIKDDCWAFTQAPGYVFYLVLFEYLGSPQLGASLLSLGLVAVLYLLLTRLKDEKTALLGVVILLFTPLYLAMWQRAYVDALAALAFCGAGGGLYLYYWMSRFHLSARMGAIVLFAAGFLLMASVGVRYTNIAIAAVFGIHFLIMAVRSRLRKERILPRCLLFGLGAALPLLGLLIYQVVVFGSPFSTGNEFAMLPVHFAWNYSLGIGYSIVRDNVIQLWVPLIIALPVLLVAVAAFVTIACGKGFFSKRSDAWSELPTHIYHVLWLWVVAVFGLYVMCEWTSFQAGAKLPFPLLTRFYLPALLPLVVISALVLRRLSAKLWGSVFSVLIVLGIIFFVQAVRITQVQYVTEISMPDIRLPAPPDNIILIQPEVPML